MGKLRLRVRFDYAGRGKNGKLFGGKNSTEQAELVRQQKVTLNRNVPIQGIQIDDIDMSQEVYTIYDEVSDRPISYAPVILTFCADSVEDAIRFTMKEEFRKVELLDPEEISLNRLELERLLVRVSEELMSYRNYMERKADNWK